MTLQPVRGTKDHLFEEAQHFQWIKDVCAHQATLGGFRRIETPIFEFTEVFHRLGESSDIVTKETYTFEDRGGESITLRPEGTAPVVRAVISNGLTQKLPLKFFYAAPMFRYERPQKGRYRQFHQFGVEFMGADQPLVDVEVMALGYGTLKALGIEKKVTLKVNTLGDKHSRSSFTKALVDYLTPLKDQLSEDSKTRLAKNPLRILDSKSPQDQEILKGAPTLAQHLTPEAKSYFDQVVEGLDALEIPYEIDTKLVRGLDYYCHTAFEFVTEDLGSQGAVIAGGRYDGLCEDLGGPALPSVGWAMGIERAQLLSQLPEQEPQDCYVVPVEDGDFASAQRLVMELRREGLHAQMFYKGALKKQLKKIDQQGAAWALIYGETEREEGGVMARHLPSGKQEFVSLKDLPHVLRKGELQ